jgi:hypothetical protein
MKISDETRKLVEMMMKESGVAHRKAHEIKQVVLLAVNFVLNSLSLLPSTPEHETRDAAVECPTST